MPSVHEKSIGGKVWTATLLPATAAMEIAGIVGRVSLPALGEGIGALTNLDTDVMPALGHAISSLGRSISDPELRTTIKRMIARKVDGSEGSVHCDSILVTPANFDEVFAGELDTMLEVAAFVLESNLKLPFSSWIGAARRSASARLAPISRLPGSSGTSVAGT